MKKELMPFIAFVAGAAVGGLATWQYTKTKYEKREQEAVDSVKEMWLREREEWKQALKPLKNDQRLLEKLLEDTPQDKETNAITEQDRKEYADVLGKVNYSGYSEAKTNKKEPNKEVPQVNNGPYIISPDDFGEIEDYDQVTLRYYADEIVADEDDEIITDVEDRIGYESLRHFGEPFDDTVYVRNDDLKTDFEIIKDEDKFEDILAQQNDEDEEWDDYYNDNY